MKLYGINTCEHYDAYYIMPDLYLTYEECRKELAKIINALDYKSLTTGDRDRLFEQNFTAYKKELGFFENKAGDWFEIIEFYINIKL